MRRLRDETGVSLIEMLMALTLVATITTGFYSVMFSGTRGSEISRSVAKVSEEARLGFNRLVRDTREADTLVAPSGSSFTIYTDFDHNGTITPRPNVNANGDYEEEAFVWNESAKTITLNDELLISGVDCIRDGSGNCTGDVFQFTSGRLEFDWNNDGVTTWRELDEAGCSTRGSYSVGNCQNPAVLDVEKIERVEFALQITSGKRTTAFYADAQLRNLR